VSSDRDHTPDPQAMSGEIWDRLCRSLENARRLVIGEGVPATPGDRAQGFRYLADLLAAGITVCVEHGDPDHPEFCRMIDHTMKWGLDAPDCLYLFASISGKHGYRIHGHTGSASHMDVQVNWGHFAEGDISKWGVISSIDTTELVVGDDGSIEITIGGDRPGVNHLTVDQRAEFVLIRQYFGDWGNEDPAELAIERIGQGPVPAAPTTADMARRYARLCDWMEKSGALWEDMSRGMLAMDPNTVFTNNPALSSERSGMRGQIYCMGNFACAHDEAVIIEFARPTAKFWTVGLANWYWQSLDYETHQSSLNMTQAAVDTDGTVRVVITHDDAGIANWLDPCGQTSGTLIIRCLLAEAAISPKITRIARNELDSCLPNDTKRSSAEERARTLRDRHAAVLHRFRR
jgi:hypothetical protein